MVNAEKTVLILIPAFNEGLSIQTVIDGLKKCGYKDILAIDDGSSDDTFQKSLAAGICAARHICNMGVGSALATGFEIAKTLNFDIVITFDADGQHDPRDVKKLVEILTRDEADVVIGSRMLTRDGMPLSRVCYNIIANIVTFILCGFCVSDTQSGLRGFNRRAYRDIRIETAKMESSSEIISRVKENGLRIKEVGIRSIYTDYSLSKGQNFGVGIKTLLRLIMSRLMKELRR